MAQEAIVWPYMEERVQVTILFRPTVCTGSGHSHSPLTSGDLAQGSVGRSAGEVPGRDGEAPFSHAWSVRRDAGGRAALRVGQGLVAAAPIPTPTQADSDSDSLSP